LAFGLGNLPKVTDLVGEVQKVHHKPVVH
jgi:hypothetical protein